MSRIPQELSELRGADATGAERSARGADPARASERGGSRSGSALTRIAQAEIRQPEIAQADGAQTDGAQTDGAENDGAENDGAQNGGAQNDGAQTDGARTDGAENASAQAEATPSGVGESTSTQKSAAPSEAGQGRATYTVSHRTGFPITRTMASRGVIPDWMAQSLLDRDPEGRMPLATALGMLDNAVAISGDPELGLHAALSCALDTPLLEYASISSLTVRESIQTFANSVMVLNDALEVVVREEGDRARVEFRELAPMNRVIMDYALASFQLGRVQIEPGDGESDTEIWFKFAQPADTSTYRSVFGRATLRFSAPIYALTFPRERLELKMNRADSRLHALLLQSIEQRVAELPQRLGLAERVRALLREDLTGDACSAKCVAERLDMSLRTLSRQLEREGTCFKALLDETRCGLTMRYLLADQLSIPEISARLGFAERASFYKAFRRWFGRTPTEYLRQYRV